MHDIDRNQLETGWETGSAGEFGYENFEFETSPETYGESFESSFGEFGYESSMGEALEMELAAELQEVANEQELEQFIGKLFNRVRKAVGGMLPPGVARSLGGMLKGLAKNLLPVAGAALGNMVVPGLGGLVGGQLAGAAGRAFGLELEGLSPEDQEFEVNRRYVRTAEEAVKQAMNAPAALPPQDVAKQALIKAAQIHAPGLISGIQSGVQSGYSNAPRHNRSHSGRWIRRGRAIILLGV